jgi:hypothetical protein
MIGTKLAEGNFFALDAVNGKAPAGSALFVFGLP